jgi:hypothetical protein
MKDKIEPQIEVLASIKMKIGKWHHPQFCLCVYILLKLMKLIGFVKVVFSQCGRKGDLSIASTSASLEFKTFL